MPEIAPNVSDLNLTPTSTGVGSAESTSSAGTVVFVPQIEHGQETLTEAPALGVSRFPLSSTARDLIVVDGFPCAVQVYDQLVVPVAGCQVLPPSVVTSTPATTPPPV